MPEALAEARGKIIYIGNLMTKPRQTDGFTLVDYVKTVEKYLGAGIIDCVIYNKEKPAKELLKKYMRQGENLVAAGDFNIFPKIKFFGSNLLSHQVLKAKNSDILAGGRSLIRHDSDKLAELIYKL